MTIQVQIYTKTFSYPQIRINSSKPFEDCRLEALQLIKDYPGLLCISIINESDVNQKRITLYRKSEDDGFFGVHPLLRRNIDQCLQM